MRIGLIGCGRIAFEAHLPAYRKYGVEVVGVCDLIEEKAKKAAKEYKIGFYTTNPKVLAAHEDVELLDIATRPQDRPSLLRALLPFQKPILVQKPICYDLREAVHLCEEFAEASVPIAVNHNARWAPVNIRIREWIEQGVLGKLYALHHVNRFNEDLTAWYTDFKDYLFLDHGLHYIDLMRWYTERIPKAVSALSSTYPKQKSRCPLLYSMNFQYVGDSPLLVSLYFNNAVPAPHGFHCNWFIDGEKGSVQATIDSIAKVDYVGNIEPMKKIEGDWIPDGFYGAYKAFVKALKENKKAPHALTDHLITLKIAAAAAESARLNGKWVEVL